MAVHFLECALSAKSHAKCSFVLTVSCWQWHALNFLTAGSRSGPRYTTHTPVCTQLSPLLVLQCPLVSREEVPFSLASLKTATLFSLSRVEPLQQLCPPSQELPRAWTASEECVTAFLALSNACTQQALNKW